MKQIAAMAEAHYVMVAPHNPMGPVANVVNVHFAVTAGRDFRVTDVHGRVVTEILA